jgi:hypothetical protein
MFYSSAALLGAYLIWKGVRFLFRAPASEANVEKPTDK